LTFSAAAKSGLPKLRKVVTVIATGLVPNKLQPKHEIPTKEIPGPCSADYCSIGATAPCMGCPVGQGA
jgi:hypothetical protein